MPLSFTEIRAKIATAALAGISDPFSLLQDVSSFLNVSRGTSEEHFGQELVIRLLDIRHMFEAHAVIIDALVRESGLFPYLNPDRLGIADALAYEMHRPAANSDTVFHRAQAQVFDHIMSGRSVVLSAPTSFGKSLIIDAIVHLGRFRNIVIVVPTLALLDETRRRLAAHSTRYKIITHSSQTPADRNIFVHTQERVIQNEHIQKTDFFVIDEFYKLNPGEDDGRAQMLNLAFHKLSKQASQFYMLGPNIQNIPDGFIEKFQCRFIRTDFNTVASEIHRFDVQDDTTHAVDLCTRLKEPTLIYVRSPARAHALATKLANALGDVGAASAKETSQWVKERYHSDWSFAKALSAGIGIHHGKLPRSLTQLMVRRFNEGAIRFLVCTSTLIEGVNTRAKHVIVLDNKINNRKFDYFTFSNIKGRSGRMLKHFIGHVYLYHEPPQAELPLVDIPVVTQSDDASDALLIQLEPTELTASSSGRVRQYYEDPLLSLEVLRENAGIDPAAQLAVAQAIVRDLRRAHTMLSWRGFPSFEELAYPCDLLWKHFTEGRPRSGATTARHLAFLLRRLLRARRFSDALALFHRDGRHVDDAIETLLDFQRQWAEFRAPNLLSAVDRIQRHVFEKYGLAAGNYEAFIGRVENVGRPPVVNALDEYGLPTQIGQVVWKELGRPDTLDEMLEALRSRDLYYLELTGFENRFVQDVRNSLMPTRVA
ncbi:DEAD/DEAH box helicase [Caballeronia concitans]|uniref:DEAD/DEAH box helicase n=1 Tax=Caballeronia concitans TaxID=1777133 RepID=A0A658QQ06_9BURK|nr:DEAD/DEAH box helicase [Caballeronia concitans]KIG07473.1 DEAD/DEAH box helicase domain protein [Burkholderia sp. MR1]SAL09043.1 DEAD/DEAH box helicase [Caballeronia concitans]